jgi:hypothetical protein
VTCVDPIEPANPRHRGWCVRCGKAVDEHSRIRMHRDRRFENEIVRELCEGLKIDWQLLNTYAGRRADRAEREYGRDFPDIVNRNMAREGADEAADGVNYPRWWLDAYNRGLIPEDEHWKAQHFEAALKYSALAFHEFAQAV